jgi:hypothetical protein
MAENKLQEATKEIEEWTRRYGFKISTAKMKTILIHRRKPRIKIWIEGEMIEMTNQHSVLGLIMDEKMD